MVTLVVHRSVVVKANCQIGSRAGVAAKASAERVKKDAAAAVALKTCRALKAEQQRRWL